MVKKLYILLFISLFLISGTFPLPPRGDNKREWEFFFSEVSRYLRNTNGSAAAPSDAYYFIKTPDSRLPNSQAFSLLTTGILKVTTGTGNVTTASGGIDYEFPLTAGNGLQRIGNSFAISAAVQLFINSKAQASGLASLNASSLVVQNPANATATPTADKIPISDITGLLSNWVVVDFIPTNPYDTGYVKSISFNGSYLYAKASSEWKRVAWDTSWVSKRFMFFDGSSFLFLDGGHFLFQ